MVICIYLYSAMDRKRILLLLEILSLLVIAFSQSGLGLDNIAVGKVASQSGVHENKNAYLAIDGHDSTSYENCAFTARNNPNVQGYWDVDLGDTYDIYSVVIYSRPNFEYRLDNTDILVSDMQDPAVTDSNKCGTIYMADRSFPSITEVICTQDSEGRPIRGQYVTLKRQWGSSEQQIVNVCEVQVMSCDDGWGIDNDNKDNDCQKTCPNCAGGATCGVVDGYCYNCEEGKWGDSCNKNCNCREVSGCPRDGYCSAGCEDGYGGYENCAIELPKMPDSFRNDVTFKLNQDNSADITFKAASLSDKVTKYVVEARSQSGTSWTEVGVTQSTDSPITVKLEPISPDEKYTVRVIPFIMDGAYEVEGIASQPTEYMILDSNESSSDDGSNTGIIAGIAVIAVVLVILIVIVVILFVRYKRLDGPIYRKNDVLIVSGKPLVPNGSYENTALVKDDKLDVLHTVTVDGNKKTKAPAPPAVTAVRNNDAGDETPEQTPSDTDADPEEIYVNQVKIPSIKVGDLYSYIQKHKAETDGFKKEYQLLPAGPQAKWDVGNKVENRNKNRFVNIRAYDHSRVILELDGGDKHSDYINADYISGYKDKPNVYVAAQGPKKSTVDDTWRMIWELKANRIVMVTNLVEDGKLKCEKYWPDGEGTYGKIKVKLVSSEKFADYTLRQFTVSLKDESRTLNHLHFTSWPDHGVPVTATALLDFRKRVRAMDSMAIGPLVVHCSAGVGRTGTFIALDYLLEQADVEGEVDVNGFTSVMRSNRVNMIQTLEQYIFVYDGLLEALMSGNTAVPCPELKDRYEQLQKIDPEKGKSILQDQFEILDVLKPAKKNEELTGMEPQNKDKNRDLEIVPSNKFRPFLSIATEGCTNYINAAYIDGYKVRLAYIVTQTPLPNTIADLWRMAYDHASRTIVMLNQLEEDDKSCPIYWPKDKETPMEIGPLKISLVEEKEDSETPSITVRDFSIVYNKKPNNPVTVKQFHLTSWSENEELPEPKHDLLDVMDLVERWQQQSGNGPITIHCRNGAQKSGLYCAASYMLEKLKLDQEVDVFHAVKHVRVSRPQNIQTLEQYKYLHELAIEYMDKYEIYANFK